MDEEAPGPGNAAADSVSPREEWLQRRAAADAAVVEQATKVPGTPGRPAIIAMSGLPGSGKTYLGVRLAERLGAAIVHSDRTRKLLVEEPKYTPSENARVFRALHEVTRRLLERGVPVVVDATNLKSSDRAPIRAIGRDLRVPCVFVGLLASPEVTRERLHQRATARDPHDYSDADWSVYEMMADRPDVRSFADIIVTPGYDPQEIAEQVERLIERKGRELGN